MPKCISKKNQMKLKIRITVLFLIFFTAFLSAEEIELAIKYLGISVVKVKMTKVNNKLTVHARSTSIASIASKIDNLYIIDYTDNYLPVKYTKKINQKKYTEDRETIYYRKIRKAERTSFIDPAKSCEYPINEASRDFFSSLFFLRNAIDNIEGEILLDANKLIWKAYYKKIGEEIIKTPLGKLNSIKVQISFERITNQEKERSDMLTNNLVNEEKSLIFWFSDDERRIPLKAKFIMKPFSVVWKIENYKE
jgi:hypothetical protein